jgi:tetratricopeptide (TPR) repeat protein
VQLRIFLGSIIIIIFCTATYAQSQSVPCNVHEVFDKELVNKLLQLTYNCQFNDAKELVNQYLQKDTISFEGNFFYAMILLHSMSYYNDYKTEIDQFKKAIDRVVKIGEDKLEQNPKDALGLFYTGGAYGFLAIYHVKKDGSSFKAASIAKKGIKMHEELIELYPDYYDAYLSLGIFHFIGSLIPWYLKPILYIFGMSGDQDKALEYLTLVSTKGTLAVYEAREFLAALCLVREDQEQAANIYKSLAIQFPNNYKYKQTATYLLKERKRYSEVVEIGKKTWEEYRIRVNALTKSDSMNISRICQYLGEVYSEQGQSKGAIEIFEIIIERNILKKDHDYFFLLLGRNYEKEHNNENALHNYKKVIELTNTSDFRKEAEERIILLNNNLPPNQQLKLTK